MIVNAAVLSDSIDCGGFGGYGGGGYDYDDYDDYDDDDGLYCRCRSGDWRGQHCWQELPNCAALLLVNLNNEFKQIRSTSKNGVVGDFAEILVTNVS